MQKLLSLTVITTWLAFGVATPSSSDRTASVQITQVSTGKKIFNPHIAHRKALRKYADGLLPFNVLVVPDDDQEQYHAPIQVGNKTFNIVFDTGSADFVLYNPDVVANAIHPHPAYVPSATARKLEGESFDRRYGAGRAYGAEVYADTVILGSQSIANQSIEVANYTDNYLQAGHFDGLVGLGFDNKNSVKPDPQKTLLSTVAAQGLPGIVTVDLRKGAPGSFTFGDIPTDLYTGDIAYAPVNSTLGYWMYTPESLKIGGKPGNSTNLVGLVDTGNPFSWLQPEVCDEYYQNVEGASLADGYYTFPCEAKLPEFSVSVAGQDIDIPPEIMRFEERPNTELCYGAIQPMIGFPDFSIYGNSFMMNHIVVFDQDNLRIGFASKKK